MNKRAVQQCESYLKDDKEYNIRNHIYPSLVRITDNLLLRSHEMAFVYDELCSNYQQHHVNNFLDIILDSAAWWNPEAAAEYREQKKQLTEINEEISKSAKNLAALLSKRSALNNHSSFRSNTHYSIVDVIDKASYDNGHYKSFLQERLKNLRMQFDLKYWPSLEDVINEISLDAYNTEISPCDPCTEAATSSQRASVADFFRAIFTTIDEYIDDGHGSLPNGFRLSDNSWSIIANCALNLEPDNLLESTNVKCIRQRFRNSHK